MSLERGAFGSGARSDRSTVRSLKRGEKSLGWSLESQLALRCLICHQVSQIQNQNVSLLQDARRHRVRVDPTTSTARPSTVRQRLWLRGHPRVDR